MVGLEYRLMVYSRAEHLSGEAFDNHTIDGGFALGRSHLALSFDHSWVGGECLDLLKSAFRLSLSKFTRRTVDGSILASGFRTMLSELGTLRRYLRRTGTEVDEENESVWDDLSEPQTDFFANDAKPASGRARRARRSHEGRVAPTSV